MVGSDVVIEGVSDGFTMSRTWLRAMEVEDDKGGQGEI